MSVFDQRDRKLFLLVGEAAVLVRGLNMMLVCWWVI